jgi:KaiC/GvpD/RAD55 family RecA-like ATPase
LIIDNDKIKEAKEKLGDKNATIIAELLELEDFDEKNLKAKSPYRDERTASFVYNKKNFTFHDFGGEGISVDLIDVLMQKKNTYLEAVQKLFEYADIEYAFGEHNVKTKTKYRYPHDENGDMAQVIEYWGKRGMSKDTLEYLNVGSDGKGNTVFKYYDTNDVLTMVKYRPARSLKHGENKNWCQSDSDTSPLLFNMNRINVTQPLLIVEGEGDAMSAIEAGYFNTVSVPLGAGNLHWIEENWDWLEQFNSIIVASDNDDAGQKMKKECIYRLGSWRTKYVEYPKEKILDNGKKMPIKDMNDTLQAFGSGYVMSMIINAKDVPVSSVTDFTEVDDLDISDMNGITTGIKPLDKELIKIFHGTLTILSGRPGSGKTSLIDQAIANTIDNDDSVFLFSKEMPERMSTNWFNFILAGRRNLVEKVSGDGEKYHVVSVEAKRKIKDYYAKKLYIYKDTESNAIEDVMKSMEDCVRKYGVKLLVLDNLMMLDLDCAEAEKNTAQTKLVNDLIKFASKFNVSVCLIAHPRKTQQMNTEIEMYDIAGSSNIINLAMRSIGLRRVSKKEQEDEKNPFRNYNVVLTIMKDRLLGKADVQMGLYYDVKSRRFFTDYDEFDHVYKWDDKEYTNKIEYPIKEEQRPFD